MALGPIAAICRKCAAEFSAAPTRSFLGFQRASCPMCRATTLYPLTRVYRITYWVMLAAMVLAFIGNQQQGVISFPGLIGMGVIVALVRDARIRGEVRTASALAAATKASLPLADAYTAGREVGSAMADIVLAFRDRRIARVKSNYLTAFRDRMATIFDDPELDPPARLRIEYELFCKHIDDGLADELVAAAMKELGESDDSVADLREAIMRMVSDMVRNEIADLKKSGLQIMIVDGIGSIAEERQKPKRLIPKAASQHPSPEVTES